MSSSYRMELDKWLGQLEVKAATVLDIGGAQLPVKNRVKSWDVQEYRIADLAQPHAGSPQPDMELDLNKDFYGGGYGDIRHKLWPEHKSCELIFCLEVFDYVYDPMNAFRTIEYLLKDGGWAWATFPSFYPLHQPIADDALRYMPGGIEKLADAAGLEIVQMIKRRPETNMLEKTWAIERMRAAKHEDHNFTGFIVEFRKP